MKLENNKVQNKIKKNFLSIFKLKKNKYNFKISRNNFDDWDSINHLNFMMSLEREFNINFSYKEFLNLNSIEKLIKNIEKKNKKTFFFKITKEDYSSFENLSNDKSLIHSNKVFCKKNNFKDVVVYGGVITAKLSYVLSKTLNGNKAISVSWNINYFKPIYIGDMEKEIVVYKKNSVLASIIVIQKVLN